jgi:hypothetical protein
MEYNPTPQQELLHDELPKAVPKGINVLTILTFIGCGFSYLIVLAALFLSKDYQTQKSELETAREKAGDGFVGQMLDGQLESLSKNKRVFPEYL